ncbi:MAG: PHP domain-containing protein [Clostridia bacterium]
MLLTDLHTHTVFSHGKGTIEENFNAAIKKGIKQLGISDHGLRHLMFNVKKRDIGVMRNEIERLNGKGLPCKLFFGIEANIYGSEGEVDLTYNELALFDYVIAGFHKAVQPASVSDFIDFSLNGCFRGFFNAPSSYRFTNAYIKAIESGKIDIISHLNLGVKVDVEEVGKAARDYGVLIELNGKAVALTDDEVDKLSHIGVGFILNSDAHSPDRIGDVSKPLEVVERVKIPLSQIVNYDKTVDMDFFKNRKNINIRNRI